MKRFRFGLRSLLLMLTLVAIYIAGHRNGFQTGYNKAYDEIGDSPMQGVYSVRDLVLPLQDLE
jgi:hypothetical protein